MAQKNLIVAVSSEHDDERISQEPFIGAVIVVKDSIDMRNFGGEFVQIKLTDELADLFKPFLGSDQDNESLISWLEGRTTDEEMREISRNIIFSTCRKDALLVILHAILKLGRAYDK